MYNRKKSQDCEECTCCCPIKVEHTISINPIDVVRDEIVQLFSYSQSMNRLSVLSPVEQTLLSLDVTTTELGQRVKLDSMAVIQYITNTTGNSISLGGQFLLYRDGITIAFLDMNIDKSKPENEMQREDLYPNLTWVDVPPTTGTHRYEVRIRLNSGNIEILDALTRSLNAIVFRQVI